MPALPPRLSLEGSWLGRGLWAGVIRVNEGQSGRGERTRPRERTSSAGLALSTKRASGEVLDVAMNEISCEGSAGR